MKSVDLLSRLRSHNIRLWAENDQLRYSAPKGGITDDLLAEIRKNKDELLNLIKNTERFRRAVSLSPVERTDTLRLSFAQERLWFLYHLFPEIPVYNVPLIIRLAGVMDIPALQKSLQALIDRHESLRTCFPTIEDQPVQVIRDDCPVPLLEHNLKDLPEAERETAADKVIEEEIQRPFDLTHGPVIRAALLRIADQDHILLITLHHIVTDGWSSSIIQRDLAALYNAQVLQQTPTLPAFPIQYVDFAHWQRQWLTGEVLEDQLRYWRTRLAEVSTLRLPLDRPRPPVQTHSGARYTFQLSKSLTQDLQALSRQSEVTLATTLLAAFQALLGRYTGQTDIAVGTPIANRTRSELENLVGFFVNSLVMRTDLSGDPTFRDLLDRVHSVALGAYEHQDLPFEQLVAELQPERDFSRNPLFQVVFAFQNVPREGAAFHGLTIRPMAKNITTTRVDLECFVWEGSEQIHVALVYNTDLFCGETIERFGTHFQKTLTEVARYPEQRISDVQILTDTERQQLLIDWNDSSSKYPRDRCVHELFEQQVEQSPDAVAVVYGDEQLTYRELNARANQLAHYLKSLGVGPEVLVGICLERSIEMIIALLGILKAGGAYVPLDPEYPKERLTFMLSDTQTPVLLTQQKLLSGLPETAARLVCLDSHWEAIGKESHENPISAAVAENLAYVMYTSGSTGRPKGVCVIHRNVVRLVKATNYASLGAEEVFLQFAPISFDASTLEIWGALLNGGRLVVFPAALPSLAQLGEMIEQHQVTFLWLTAGLFHQMVEDHLGSLGSVRQLLAGGDVLSVPHVKRVLEQLDGCCLINGYGPTENTTFTTCYPMTDVSALGSSVPIGRPIANTRVYILDAQLQPVPIGVPGELYTGGDGLARGYLNQPELTAEKFIPDPFSEDSTARLYKTGDLARYLPDGSIEFLGRIDHQVKIRGFRIEVGEIETVLSQHPDVQEAVVVVREEPQGEKRLVGYVVSAQEAVSASELRQHLKQTLPEYMVPAIFMKLDALPLTPNGKVDRQALPVPEVGQLQVETDFGAPRSPYEDAVAEIWRDTLGLEQVGIYDNFFDLGGHSLLATKIVSRLRATFAVDIPLRAFFDSPTIAGVSATLAMARRGEEPTEKVGILPVDRNGTLPLSFAQERFWMLDQIHTNRAVFSGSRGFRLRGPFELEVFRESVQALVDHHEILRTTFASVDGRPHQVIAPTLSVEVPLQNCSDLSKEEQAGMIQQAYLEEKRFQFDLAQGPLFRGRILRFAEDDHFLVLNFHHIILDAWSLEIIIKELVTAYTAGCAGHAVTLPTLPIQYVDYAHWQRALLEGPIGREQLAFWKTQLAQLPPALPLPTDYARPTVQTFQGASEGLQLSLELLAPLRALNRQEGTTLFMVLLATLQFLLHRLTGTHDILVGSPIAGRDQQELHGVIGCFLNTLVLRTDLSGDLTGRDLLQRVREVVLNAYENQDVPFEKVLAEVDPARDLSRTPIFQVLLNMHSFDDQNLPLPGLSVTPVHSTDINSLFDMTLYFYESTDKIHLSLAYNADLFTAERMTEFMRQFQSILEQMINDPDRPLEAFTLVTPSACLYLPDPSALLTETLQTSIIEMFANWVKRTPEQSALSKGDQTLTYEMLFERTQILARILRLNGLDRGDVVAVYGPRSFGLIVNMMAVFLSGGVLLPIDDSLPRQRQQLILQEASAKFLLYIRGRGFEDAWWEQDSTLGVQSLEVDTKGLIRADTDFDLDAISLPELGTDDAAYIFFTSGTTGVPKGVLGSHKGLNHFLNWQRETFDITPEDRVANLTSLSFDPVLREIFLPLTSGATLCLPEDINILAANDVLSWLDRERISVLHTVPSLAQSWLTNATVEVSSNAMRWVFFAGESLTQNLVDRWQSSFPSAEIVNLYGPAETTLAKCFYQLSSGVQHGVQPLGRPLPQTQALVLSRDNQLCSIGEPGEIVLRTPFRSLGYVNNHEENRKRFVKNPFRDDEKDQLYYTGDSGRYRPDGMLDFLGRIDDQVKIRGVRVEPNEITVTLARHPEVDSCFVTNKRDEQRQTRLVAYVVLTDQSKTTVSELRAYLSKELPVYMIPSAFVFLDALPLTTRGKIDRRALPAPDVVRPDLEEVFIAPRTQTEELVAGIWSNVLGVERIGVYDSFFELGGHSLLVVQIISRIREVFEVELPLRALFETPTVAGLIERIETAHRSDEGLQTSPLQAVSRDQDLPLSFSQERLWFLHHLEPDSVAYGMPRNIRLKGVLSKDALQKTYNELARRHETLRTTFYSTDGNPLLRIAAEPNILFDTVDLRHLPGVQREAEVKRLSEEDARKPFDLTRGPLFRIRLFQLEDEEHVLHSNMHHIISDFWSFGVMAREVAALYTAFIKDKPADLPELPVQYADYAVWQRQWLQGEALETQLNYWKDKLGGELPVLELPTDRPRPAVQTHRGAMESLALSKELTDALQEMSRREGVTLFMTLLAAFKTLLYRLTGQEDTIVGTPIAGRNRTELEGLIGFFMNTIVMRTDLSGNPTFRELSGRVRETALGAYAHQDMPFEKLVEKLAPERDLSRTPLFQVFFNHGVAMDDKVADLPGLEAEAVGGLEDRESKFDMTLYVLESEGGIKLRSLYNTDLFDSWRMTEMLKQYEVLLKQIVENSDEKISHYSLVTAKAHHVLPDPSSLLTEPLQTSITEMFANWVKQTPEQPALSKGDQTLTYEMLFERTQTLARILRLNGLDRGDVVAVYGPRSFGLIVNMMAVFLSGGVLLLIDNSLPRQRQQLILQESGAKFLLNIRDRGFEDAWWEQDSTLGVQTLEVDTKGLVRGDTDFDLNAISLPELSIDDAAYIFFTSGTTGVPKGVLGSHKGLNHFLNWQRETFDITPEDRVAHLTSLSFDPVLREIFLPLTSGATLCLPEDIDILAANDVLSWLDCERISVLHTVPSLAQSWLTNTTVEVSLNTMRWVFFAGESLTENLVDRWQSSLPSAEIVNLYGPAETTLAKCFYQLSSGVHHGVQPLGRPLPQTQALVLSRDNQLCSIGEPGEIVLRTPFRSLGYINNHEENRKRFVKNPFRDDEKDQLYYTGDRGRYRPDGMLEFLGRLDDQVKIRGVRVEPKEITATLARHPKVDSCFVTNKIDEQRRPRLVAYVVIKGQSTTTVTELRAYVKKQLPATMVPEAFVFLSYLPLTNRGKVDRRALPVPDERRPDIEESFAAPRNAMEEALAEIWGEILRIEKVGIQDNFFELGGHSLLATQIISRLSYVFQVEIPLRQLFLYPTIAELALIIAGKLEKTEQENVKQLLDEFEDLSDEEAELLLVQELRQNERANRSE